MTGRDYDVIVIGGGGAGLAAAASAAGLGASTIVVEAAAAVGGSTRLSGGSYMAAGTQAQREAGYPDDSVQEFYDYYMTFNQWQADPPVVRAFCENATPTYDWLISLGVMFRNEWLGRAGLERVPRTHVPDGGGEAYVKALDRECRRTGVDYALGTRVTALVRDGAGKVCGIDATGGRLTAAAVIVATGGLGHNARLLREHVPDVRYGADDIWSPAAATCVGDGLELVTAIGGGTAGHNCADLLLSPGFARDLEPYLPSWLLFVDPTGKRFVNERAPYTVLANTTIAHGGYCWAVLDEPMLDNARPKKGGNKFGGGSWIADTLREQVRLGRVLQAPTVAELAELMHVSPRTLASTLEIYNSDCASGVDSRFDKRAGTLVPVASPPFYAVRMRPMIVAVTGYGVKIDAEARVLDAETDKRIPGLYAAGEVTGNVLGRQYLGGGNAIGSALIFGRIAGLGAARSVVAQVTAQVTQAG